MGQSNAVGHGVPMEEKNIIQTPLKNVFGLSRKDNQSFDNTELIWSGYTSYGMNLAEEQDNTYSVANCLAALWQKRIDSGNDLPDLYIIQIAIGAQGVTKEYMWYPEFVRQQDTNKCGFLTAYDLKTNTWDSAVEIEDCQSRGDFILCGGELYLFHAPIDREHIGIVKIDTTDIAKSEVVLQAKMHTSCFYPFVQYYNGNELAMSYTVARKHIRLAEFTLNKYL